VAQPMHPLLQHARMEPEAVLAAVLLIARFVSVAARCSARSVTLVVCTQGGAARRPAVLWAARCDVKSLLPRWPVSR
jgi:hypothetical protein